MYVKVFTKDRVAMKIFKVCVLALGMFGAVLSNADSADEYWAQRALNKENIAKNGVGAMPAIFTVQKITNNFKDAVSLTESFMQQWKVDAKYFKQFNPNPIFRDLQSLPSKEEAAVSYIHRECLKKFTNNLNNLVNGFDECLGWCQTHGYSGREDEVCGANYGRGK